MLIVSLFFDEHDPECITAQKLLADKGYPHKVVPCANLEKVELLINEKSYVGLEAITSAVNSGELDVYYQNHSKNRGAQ